MNCEFIETGRYEYPTIWINGFKPLGQFPYPDSNASLVALTRTQAIELRQELSKAIHKAVKAVGG